MSSGDRFIPSRQNNNFHLFYIDSSNNEGFSRLTNKLNAASKSEGEYFLNITKEENYVKAYKKILTETLIPNSGSNILSFSSSKKKNVPEIMEEEMWPVDPRSKPLMPRPNTILDLPNIPSDMHLENIMDWSKSGYMATVHRRNIFIWHENCKKDALAIKSTISLEGCLKWDLEGNYLMVASENNCMYRLSPQSLQTNPLSISCDCDSISGCKVIAMEFTFNGKFISSCTRGKLCLFDTKEDYKLLEFTYVSKNVKKIVSSCFGTYFATNSGDNELSIWRTDTFKILHRVKVLAKKICTISFHPWKEVLLVIGFSSRLSLWNINLKKCVFQHKIPNGVVQCASFNPLSAELVVAYYCTGLHDMENGDNFIMVLKNFNTIVDQVRFHSAPVFCLLWNGNGNKLATGGMDENVCLWDFFGNMDYKKRFSKSPKSHYLDMFNTFNLLKSTIR